jgi:hypothetical protein
MPLYPFIVLEVKNALPSPNFPQLYVGPSSGFNLGLGSVSLGQDDANNVESVIQEQEDWDEEILDYGVVQMLHN